MNKFDNIHLVFFGNKHTYKKSLERLKTEAIDFGFKSKQIHIYTKDNISAEFFKTFKCNTTRGYGYWMWKPYIILDVMSKIPVSDIVLYMDCGSSLNNKGIDRFFSVCRLYATISNIMF